MGHFVRGRKFKSLVWGRVLFLYDLDLSSKQGGRAIEWRKRNFFFRFNNFYCFSCAFQPKKIVASIQFATFQFLNLTLKAKGK